MRYPQYFFPKRRVDPRRWLHAFACWYSRVSENWSRSRRTAMLLMTLPAFFIVAAIVYGIIAPPLFALAWIGWWAQRWLYYWTDCDIEDWV
jgi:hypothetical protein